MLHSPWLNFIVKSVSRTDNKITNSGESDSFLSKNVLTLRLVKLEELPVQTCLLQDHEGALSSLCNSTRSFTSGSWFDCASAFCWYGTEAAEGRAP